MVADTVATVLVASVFFAWSAVAAGAASPEGSRAKMLRTPEKQQTQGGLTFEDGRQERCTPDIIQNIVFLLTGFGESRRRFRSLTFGLAH